MSIPTQVPYRDHWPLPLGGEVLGNSPWLLKHAAYIPAELSTKTGRKLLPPLALLPTHHQELSLHCSPQTILR